MNDLGPILVVLAAQVTLPILGGLILSRRRNPAAACGPLVVAAVAALLLTPLAFVPRPSLPTKEKAAAHSRESNSVDAIAPTASAEAVPGGIDLLKLFRLPKPQPAHESANRLDPWRIVAFGIIGLAAFGLGRLLLGLLATSRTVRASRPVMDPHLLTVAKELRHRLNCQRIVALRESERVGTAATAGWLRPVILLSPTWRLWSADELRAVLAHEIAHVARGDFATRALGRLAVALHGYHPFVRWLASRLELQQEMAADAQAAQTCGGRPVYLKCLAALALRADSQPLGLSPTFLSRPRTLLRRIAMLRVMDDTRTRRRWPALAAVALLAAGALALHGTTPKSLAGPVIPARFIEKDRPALDVTYVVPTDSADDVGVFAIRVGALFKTPGMEKMAEMYSAMVKNIMGEGKIAKFDLTDIEQVSGRVTMTHQPTKPAPNSSISMSLSSIRMTQDFDWVKQLKEWATDWKDHTHAGVKYYSGKMTIPAFGFKDMTAWFYMPDARTMVSESDENIKKLIDNKGKPITHAWAKDWQAVNGGMAAIVLTDLKGKVAGKMPTEKTDDKVKEQGVKIVTALCKKSTRAAIGFDMGEGLSVKLRLACASADDAIAVDEGCQALGKLAKAVFEEDKEEPKDPIEKAGKKLSTMLIRGIEFGKTVDHVVEVRISTASGMSEFLKAFSAAADGK
jgi:beta-lactamase regulating signal transducer with metallopeptidase domain